MPGGYASGRARSLRIRSAALLVALFAAVFQSACAERQSLKPPDIFVLLIDALRADRVGWYGAGKGVSPFLDRMAERASVFRHAYAASSWTSPSVASLFTSRFPSQHGIETFSSVLDPSERTLAEELQAAGYATAAFNANVLINAGLGYGQGFETYQTYVVPTKERASLLDHDALEWLAAVKSARPASPVFLYMHYLDVHEPLLPPVASLQAVAERRSLSPRDAARLEELVATHASMEFMDEHDQRLAEHLYDAELLALDHELEVFVGELERRGLLEDALLVITADHGEELLDHGGVGHGHTLYEELIHVPLLVKLPHQARRADFGDVVSLVDIAPTLVAAAGLPPPATFQGTSRFDEMRRPKVLRAILALFSGFFPGSAYSELGDFGANQARPKLHARALVEGRAKLIERRDQRTEVYDLGRDPGEHAASVAASQTSALQERMAVLRHRISERTTAARTTDLDAETREQMRALGYDSRRK